METRFASLGRNGVAYEILSYDNKIETWNSRSGYLSGQIAEYQCYDDGLVRHSYPCLVYGENIIDCLISLAMFLNDRQNDKDLLKLVDSIWPQDIYRDKVEFARSVKYNADKKRFYNISDLKVSSSEKMQYDKRWEEIPSWANGSLKALCLLVIPQYSDGLHKYYYYHQLQRDTSLWDNVEGCMVDLPGERYESPQQNASTALHICDNIIKAYRLQCNAERSIECLMTNLAYQEKQASVAA